MKNPLNKRLPREFRKDFGKYLVIFLLLVITIGFVSGFLVADGSMIKAYNESFERYTIEDGHFNVDKKLNNQSLINISKAGVHLYDHSYVEELINAGMLDREQGRIHPKKNVITRTAISLFGAVFASLAKVLHWHIL